VGNGWELKIHWATGVGCWLEERSNNQYSQKRMSLIVTLLLLKKHRELLRWQNNADADVDYSRQCQYILALVSSFASLPPLCGLEGRRGEEEKERREKKRDWIGERRLQNYSPVSRFE
jgi:hypothetical protein